MQCRAAQRVHILHCAKQGKSQAESYHLLHAVYGNESLSRVSCSMWYRRFANGETSVADRPRPGRVSTARCPEKLVEAQELVDNEQCISVRNLASSMGVSVGSAHRILRKDLELKKKAPKFIPRILTDDQEQRRLDVCTQNLCLFKEDPSIKDRIITGDESWFSCFEPELKSRSSLWLPKGAPRPKKALRCQQAKHTMVEVFFDSSGLVHIEFLPPKMTVTAKVYVGVLARLRESIRRRRPHLWKDSSYRILHDNAPGHTANKTVAMMETEMYEVLHPPYSPDLAPCDFWLFPYLKAKIRGTHFNTVADLQDRILCEIEAIPKALFHQCFHETLPARWGKCVTAQGKYFEGDGLAPADVDLE